MVIDRWSTQCRSSKLHKIAINFYGAIIWSVSIFLFYSFLFLFLIEYLKLLNLLLRWHILRCTIQREYIQMVLVFLHSGASSSVGEENKTGQLHILIIMTAHRTLRSTFYAIDKCTESAFSINFISLRPWSRCHYLITHCGFRFSFTLARLHRMAHHIIGIRIASPINCNTECKKIAPY